MKFQITFHLFLLLIIIFLKIKTTKEFDLLIYFLSAALIVSIVLSSNGFLNKILKTKILIWLGIISYSVYMSHAAVEWTMNQIFRVVLKKPERIGDTGVSVPQLTLFEAIVAYLIVCIIVLIISALIYNFFEKPIREKSRQFSFKKVN